MTLALLWILAGMLLAGAVVQAAGPGPAEDNLLGRLSAGMRPRTCYVGDFPHPYEVDHLTPGGCDRQRLGGLCWELDVTDAPPHVCGRSVPGFRHFEYFEQAGPALQRYGAYDLGAIAPAGADDVRLEATESTWTRCTLRYGCRVGGRPEPFAVTVSRLTPAVLVEGSGPSLGLFGGPQRNWGRPVDGASEFEDQRRVPTFLAVPGPGGPRTVPAADAGSLPLETLRDGWLLLWWGPRVFTSDTADPVLTTHAYRRHWWGREMWRDVPVLAVFERPPCEVRPGDGGGLLVRWQGRAGRLALMPLLGGHFPDTAGWERGLPDDVAGAAAFWAPRLRVYPTDVAEHHAVDRATGEVRVAVSFEFTPVGDGGVRFAPLPPMLALAARYGFPVRVDPPPVDPAYLTPIGPLVGVEGEGYAYTIGGTAKYVDERLAWDAPSPACEDLRAELADQVARVVAVGEPLVPLVEAIAKRTPHHTLPAPWSNPCDPFALLPTAGRAARLPPAELAAVTAYVERLGRLAPPDRPGWTPYHVGICRITGEAPSQADRRALEEEFLTGFAGGQGNRAFFPGCALVPPEHPYALWTYLDAGGAWDLPGRWPGVFENLRPFLTRMDWANLGWSRWDENYECMGKWGVQFRSIHYGCGGVADVNRWLAGMIGYARLARLRRDAAQEALARYLFARAAVLRFAMGVFARWLHDEHLVVAPAQPDWYVRANDRMADGERVARETAGYPFALHWRGPQDDIRQVVILDEFGPSVRQTLKVYMQEVLPTFHHLVPEVGRFLADHLREPCAAYVAQCEDHMPDWELAWGDSVLGSESSTIDPANGCQLFLAKAYVLGAGADELRARLDIPWCRVGDLYYMGKLAATLAADAGRWRPVAE